MSHKQLVIDATKAINRVFSDHSVSSEQTMDSLDDLRCSIDELSDAIQADLDTNLNKGE